MSTAVRFTSADLEGFPDDGKRREIIDGELVVSSQPHLYHQVMGDGLVAALNLWGEPRQVGLAISAPGLIFSPEEDVAPDVVWISTERLRQVHSGGKLYAAPELVIEILSPGRRNIVRDREAKRKIYSRYGVREYWIVDWVARTIEVYRRAGEQLALIATLLVSDTLTSPLLPEFSLSLERIFARIPAGATYTEDRE
jgi:Uma2 family endonuclease